MATVYEFLVKKKTIGDDSSKPRSTKGAAKKGKNLPLLGGSKGGVEHNRKMRAINPILNKVTNGYWEKGMRLGRATAGLVRVNDTTGKLTLSGTSIAIIVAFILITVWNGIAKWNQRERANADKLNAQNFKAMENGSGTVHGAYKIAVNGWTGHMTYNENK